MKKVISFVLSLVMCLSLCACNSSSKAMQDPATAPFLDLDAYGALKKEDPDQAKKEYDGKAFRCTGAVVYKNISEGKCYFGVEEYDSYLTMYITKYTLCICLANEADFEKVKSSETYTFAGILDTSEDVPVLREAQIIE